MVPVVGLALLVATVVSRRGSPCHALVLATARTRDLRDPWLGAFLLASLFFQWHAVQSDPSLWLSAFVAWWQGALWMCWCWSWGTTPPDRVVAPVPRLLVAVALGLDVVGHFEPTLAVLLMVRLGARGVRWLEPCFVALHAVVAFRLVALVAHDDRPIVLVGGCAGAVAVALLALVSNPAPGWWCPRESEGLRHPRRTPAPATPTG